VSRSASFDFQGMQAQGNNVGLQLYVLMMTPLPLASAAEGTAATEGPSPLEIHYAYIHDLIEQGKVLLIGPCMDEPVTPGYAPVPPGIGILTVSSREEAEEIARKEPFGAMGWRRNTVTAWTPKFGSLIPTLISTIGG